MNYIIYIVYIICIIYIMPSTSKTFPIALIADNDQSSKSVEEPDTWNSALKRGTLTYNPRTRNVMVNFEEGSDTSQLSSRYSYKDRGMELSELITFNEKLLSVDDQTGIVYEIINDKVVPWVVLSDGDGKQSKGYKGEWMTVKDDSLYVGSHGKPSISASTGDEKDRNMQWIKIITKDGVVSHINWEDQYTAMQNATGCVSPGYLTHESAVWSDVHKLWFFLPRKASKEAYDDKLDEQRATNLLIKCSEDFSDIQVTRIGGLEYPSRGYSTFKFIPGSNDEVIVAIKTEEIGDSYKSFITVFTIQGKVLLPDTQVSDTLKFEGLAFI